MSATGGPGGRMIPFSSPKFCQSQLLAQQHKSLDGSGVVTFCLGPLTRFLFFPHYPLHLNHQLHCQTLHHNLYHLNHL